MMPLIPIILAFLLCFLLPILIKFFIVRHWGDPVSVRVDPLCPRASDIADYFRQIAISLDENPRRMCLTLNGCNEEGKTISLDFKKDKTMQVFVGEECENFSLRNRWIAEHPLPLVFSGRKRVLYIQVVDANRFRVMASHPFTFPMYVYLFSMILFCIGLFIPSLECIVSSLSFSLSVMLCNRTGNRE